MRITGVLNPVALQCAQIVRVAELSAHIVEDRPVSLLALGPNRAIEMAHQIGDDTIIVEESVIDVEEEHHVI